MTLVIVVISGDNRLVRVLTSRANVSEVYLQSFLTRVICKSLSVHAPPHSIHNQLLESLIESLGQRRR